jgi:hypothetical protein
VNTLIGRSLSHADRRGDQATSPCSGRPQRCRAFGRLVPSRSAISVHEYPNSCKAWTAVAMAASSSLDDEQIAQPVDVAVAYPAGVGADHPERKAANSLVSTGSRRRRACFPCRRVVPVAFSGRPSEQHCLYGVEADAGAASADRARLRHCPAESGEPASGVVQEQERVRRGSKVAAAYSGTSGGVATRRIRLSHFWW